MPKAGTPYTEQQRQYNRDYYDAHRDERREYNREWHVAHREERHAQYEAHRDEHKEYHAKRYAAHREERMEQGRRHNAQRKLAIGALKTSIGCADCGYDVHPEALDFDHLPGTTKSFDIGTGRGRKWADVLAEIEKCEVVCANCHRVRTATRRDNA